MCGKVDFQQIRQIFIVEMRKLPAKAGKNRGVTALPKPLVATGELQCDLHQTQKWPVKQKSLISTPENGMILTSQVIVSEQFNK